MASAGRQALRFLAHENFPSKLKLRRWVEDYLAEMQPKYSRDLYSELPTAAIHVNKVLPDYDEDTKEVDGRIVLRDNFEALFSKYPNTMVFGEDTGKIGDVNQGLEGLQKKFGDIRIADTGIRETSIIGQGIGLALRGLRPIAEIQYLDYILYAIQTFIR